MGAQDQAARIAAQTAAGSIDASGDGIIARVRLYLD